MEYDIFTRESKLLWGKKDPVNVETTEKCDTTMRTNHCTAIKNNKMYVFFGKNRFLLDSILSFDFENIKWEEMKTIGEKLERKIGMECVYVTKSDSIYIFGGLDGNGFSSNEMIQISLKNFESKIICKANLNDQDYGVHFHSMVYDGDDSIYIYGGKNEKGETNNFLKFEISKNQFFLIENKKNSPPPPSCFSHLFFINSNIILIDGKNLSTVYFFDFHSSSWEHKKTDLSCFAVETHLSKKFFSVDHDPLNQCFYLVGGNLVDEIDDFTICIFFFFFFTFFYIFQH